MIDKSPIIVNSTAKLPDPPEQKAGSGAESADVGAGSGLKVACFPACAIPPVPVPPVAVPVEPAGVVVDSTINPTAINPTAVRRMITPTFGRFAVRGEDAPTNEQGAEGKGMTEQSDRFNHGLSAADFQTSGYLKNYAEGMKSWGQAGLLSEIGLISKQSAADTWSGGVRQLA